MINPTSSLAPSASDPQVPGPSEMERKFYYFGLSTAPVLVARTGATPWEAPTGPEAYIRRKVVRLLGFHAIHEVWEDRLEAQIHTLLDSMQVKWTDVDITRIGYDGDPPQSAPVILWIRVIRGSLSTSDGVTVAQKCRSLLEEHGITDVDVEIHEPPAS